MLKLISRRSAHKIESKKPKEELHSKAFTKLKSMHTPNTPPFMKIMLNTFKKGRGISQENFLEGITRFTEFANLDFGTREKLFGNRHLGLHYASDLSKDCSENYSDPVSALELAALCPHEWEHTVDNGTSAFLYKGRTPAQALDSFIKGPTAIDCGMFTQLSIWFGIRNMLGDEKFNQLFGQAPFYITQANYAEIKDPTKPCLGNPLHPFFNDEKSTPDQVSVRYYANSELYINKHPGSNASGQNCINLKGLNTIFSPLSERTRDLTETEIQTLLIKAFNQKPNDNDAEKIDIFKNLSDQPSSSDLQPALYELRITQAEELKEHHISVDNLGGKTHERFFDLEKFQKWVNTMTERPSDDTDYVPEEAPSPSTELSRSIPGENLESMTFTFFKANSKTPQQADLLKTAKRFCSDVLNGRSSQVILTGKAGLGKTASAVCCAKELESKGKKVLWLSEVMIKSWTDQADSMAAVLNCRDNIRKQLNGPIDAIILDDDNLASFAGKVLLEEVYNWYLSTPGKGLYITSNEDLDFHPLYGTRLDHSYHFAPFTGYDSEQYMNTTRHSNLSGDSLRETAFDQNPMSLDEETRISYLSEMDLSKLDGPPRSAGIVIGNDAYEAGKARLGQDIEFIPSITCLDEISSSLKFKDIHGEHYDNLTEIQKAWIITWHDRGGVCSVNSLGETVESLPCQRVAVRNFENTQHPVIAIELSEYEMWEKEILVTYDSMNQLLRVINFAHDNPGKKVVIINRTTKFSNEALLDQIIAQLPASETQRSSDRLRVLFGL